jgi:hypothetical protein
MNNWKCCEKEPPEKDMVIALRLKNRPHIVHLFTYECDDYFYDGLEGFCSLKLEDSLECYEWRRVDE